MIGDFFTHIISGFLTAYITTLIVNPDWPMFTAMLAGMAIGFAYGLISLPLFVIFFGAMEVMIPMMLTTKITGMVAGMAMSMTEQTNLIILVGASIGLFVIIMVKLSDPGIKKMYHNKYPHYHQ